MSMDSPNGDHPCKTTSLRGDGYCGGGYLPLEKPYEDGIQLHNYEPDESEVWQAYVAQLHFKNRGHWWTTGKSVPSNDGF